MPKNLLIIIGAALAAAAVLSLILVFLIKRRKKKAQSKASLKFIKLLLHESGSTAEESEYELIRTEKGLRISHFFGNWWDETDGTHSRKNCLAKRRGGSMELYNELVQLMDEINVAVWNGFDEKTQNVLDGSGFWLVIELENGERIKACGQNSYPENYDILIGKLRSLFEN